MTAFTWEALICMKWCSKYLCKTKQSDRMLSWIIDSFNSQTFALTIFPIFPLICKCILHIRVGHALFSPQSVCTHFVGWAGQRIAAGWSLLQDYTNVANAFFRKSFLVYLGIQAKSCFDPCTEKQQKHKEVLCCRNAAPSPGLGKGWDMWATSC